MIRLFVEEDLEEGKVISLDEKKAHYLIHVMRCEVGGEVSLFNGKDGEFQSEILQEAKKKFALKIVEKTKDFLPTQPCVLCPAIIKKENMDFVLQKATELGVSEIFPVITDRTVVRNFNLERAKSIVAEAAEQSERLDCPIVHEPTVLIDLFKKLPEEATVFFLSERGETTYQKTDIKTPVFLIGPEGGFTPKEVQYIEMRQNTATLHLGTTILRAETASIAILSCWQYQVF